MKKEAEMLIEYAQADFAKRMYLFLQYPDLRAAFQQIEQCKFYLPSGSSYSTEQQDKEKMFSKFFSLTGAYFGTAGIRTLRIF